jgi:hypothetical protein
MSFLWFFGLFLCAVIVFYYFFTMGNVSVKKENIGYRWHRFIDKEENLFCAIGDFLFLAIDYKKDEMAPLAERFFEFERLLNSLEEVNNQSFFLVKEKENVIVSEVIALCAWFGEKLPSHDLLMAYSAFNQCLVEAGRAKSAFAMAMNDFDKALPFFLRPAIS